MDFHATHQAALKIAGTVALPSPFPAFGSLWIVVAPEDGEYETYIRIVQHVSSRRIITRYVRLADVRAIRAPETEAAHGDSGNMAARRSQGNTAADQQEGKGASRRRDQVGKRK